MSEDILIKVWKKKKDWKSRDNPEVKEWVHCYTAEQLIENLVRIKKDGNYGAVTLFQMNMIAEEFLKNEKED